MSPERSAYFRGLRASLPFTVVAIPFGMLFGVVSTEAGLHVWETMVFTIAVFAGASQFAAIQTMQENAPVVIVLLTALAVNLRMLMYSVALAPHFGTTPLWLRAVMSYFLVDQTFATTIVEVEKNPHLTQAEKVAFFFGTVTPIVPAWFAAALAGAIVGRAVPPEWALDFALPITFLGMVAPMLRSLPHVAAAATGIALSLALAWMPFGTGLLVAATIAMAVGALLDAWREAQK